MIPNSINKLPANPKEGETSTPEDKLDTSSTTVTKMNTETSTPVKEETSKSILKSKKKIVKKKMKKSALKKKKCSRRRKTFFDGKTQLTLRGTSPTVRQMRTQSSLDLMKASMGSLSMRTSTKNFRDLITKQLNLAAEIYQNRVKISKIFEENGVLNFPKGFYYLSEMVQTLVLCENDFDFQGNLGSEMIKRRKNSFVKNRSSRRLRSFSLFKRGKSVKKKISQRELRRWRSYFCDTMKSLKFVKNSLNRQKRSFNFLKENDHFRQLPPITKNIDSKLKTIVLDLDETLIHCDLSSITKSDALNSFKLDDEILKVIFPYNFSFRKGCSLDLT